LIELMIVVAIIGILAGIALPAYQDYTRRAKLSEVVLAGSACKVTVTEAYQTSPTLPQAGAWGCEGTAPSSKYVASVSTDAAGVVSITVASGIDRNRADGKVVTLIPYADDARPMTGADLGKSPFKWICGGPGTTVDLKLLPASCHG
jgi:type IV pilus assembly protein PilA